ncbi:MAG: flagellar basal-body MS-ring/collar protein FliF [Solirubrobacteraceae bacterium]
MPFLANLAKLPARSKAVLAASALGVLLVAFFLLRLAGAPSYTLLTSGLDPAQTGKITAALDEQGIGYELRSNGTALAVDKAQTAKARVALAGEGVSVGAGGSDEGWKLFDDQKLGASEMQQRVTYQRALEGEVATTINGVSGVSGAQVQLVLPEDDLFADTATPATAAVMLGNPADTLESGAVQGIAQLVSSSVKGLKTDNVTITDSSGQLLWPQGDGAGGGGGAAGGSKQAAEARFDRAMEANLNAMLAGTLGPDKARVQVNADLNVDQTTRDELTYAKRGVPLKTKTESEKLRGGSARAGGTAGSGANIPSYSAGGGAGGGASSNYQRTTKDVEMAVDKRVSKTVVAPGAVTKLNVALLVDRSVPADVVASLEQSVAAAAGVDAERGDPAITVTQMPFAKPVVEKAGPVPASMLGPIKWAGLGLATLLFLFFTRRALKKREGEAVAAPSWLTEVEEPVALADLEQRTRELGAPTITLPPRVPDTSLRQLDQLMDREPERVAAQVKQWMSEE